MAFNLEPSANSGKLNSEGFLSEKSEKLIPIDKLLEWDNQPFKPYSDDALRTLAASISTNGLLTPIIVRPEGDKYRIIAGHNRARACRMLGWTDITAVVKDTDEIHAKLMMLDTNLCQRQALSPSELIRAYKAQYEVLSEIEGKGYGVQKIIAEQYNLNRKTISKYLKCASLSDALLELLDEGRLSFRTAEIFVGLSEGNQSVLAEWLADNPSFEMNEDYARQIAEQDRYGLDEETINEIVFKKKTKQTETPAVPIPVENNQKQDTATAEEKTKSVSENETPCKEQPPEETSSDTPSEDKPQDTPPAPPPAADENSAVPAAEQDTEDEENYVVSFSHDEVSQTIGEIDKDELGEYFCYCLQRDDIIAEWLDTRTQNDECKQLEKGASPY
ncbi:MAG: ParB/RepB/Spo0J family partition protein [Oscillospiraceae bacterium]